jgi:hypothetical protein
MGSGKGAPAGWVAVVKPGRILFEMAGVPEELAREAMRLASHKLPIATKFVTRRDFEGEYETVETGGTPQAEPAGAATEVATGDGEAVPAPTEQGDAEVE